MDSYLKAEIALCQKTNRNGNVTNCTLSSAWKITDEEMLQNVPVVSAGSFHIASVNRAVSIPLVIMKSFNEMKCNQLSNNVVVN